MIRRLLTLCVLASLVMAMVPSMAQAAETPCDPADPECAVTFPTGDINEGISSGADGSTCRQNTMWIEGRNLVGWTLWRYNQQIKWCYKGGKITSASRLNRWGTVSGLVWEFKGHTGSAISGGKGKTSYNAWTQGHFAACAVWVCAQHKYPWIRQIGYANGTYSASANF